MLSTVSKCDQNIHFMQEWPICVTYGAILGYLIGVMVSFGFIVYYNRRHHGKRDWCGKKSPTTFLWSKVTLLLQVLIFQRYTLQMSGADHFHTLNDVVLSTSCFVSNSLRMRILQWLFYLILASFWVISKETPSYSLGCECPEILLVPLLSIWISVLCFRMIWWNFK